jgi:predicted RNA-binding Zn ribbon-like protein
VWDTWGVQDAKLGENGWMYFAFDQRRIYAPLEHRELAHHFAHIARSDTALVPFVQSYGRLGWYELVHGDRARPSSDAWFSRTRRAYGRLVGQGIRQDRADVYAEPVDWIKAHARTVEWCLAAGHALQSKKLHERQRECERLASTFPTPAGLRASLGTLMRERMIHKQPAPDFVGGLLQDYLWINLRGVRRRVTYAGGRVRSVWGGDSLIESIYTLVADSVTAGRLAQCSARDCGAVFVQTDERQKFCPPREGHEKSPCMNRERVRRYRQRVRRGQRKGGRHGKTTRTR